MERLLANLISGHVQTEADWRADYEADTDAKSEGITWDNYSEALEEVARVTDVMQTGDLAGNLACVTVQCGGRGYLVVYRVDPSCSLIRGGHEQDQSEELEKALRDEGVDAGWVFEILEEIARRDTELVFKVSGAISSQFGRG